MSYASASPIPRAKTDTVHAFFAEVLGPRRAELDDLYRRSGVTEEAYWLQLEPDGNDILIVVSNSDQADSWAIMANPQTPFDRWYRDQIENIWEFDASAPRSPLNEEVAAVECLLLAQGDRRRSEGGLSSRRSGSRTPRSPPIERLDSKRRRSGMRSGHRFRRLRAKSELNQTEGQVMFSTMRSAAHVAWTCGTMHLMCELSPPLAVEPVMEDETTEPKIPPLRPLTPEQIDALLGHLPHLEAVARGDFEPGSTGMWGPESVQSEQTRVFFHDLRHGCASLLLAAGVPPRTIMGVLGHSQISLTLNTYSHLSPALEREAADALDRMLVG